MRIRVIDLYINLWKCVLMYTSTSLLNRILTALTSSARSLGMNDTAWAARAGFSKETLSRLRRRSSCDFVTLVALMDAVGAGLSVSTAPAETSPDGHFPLELNRDYEQRLLTMCASRILDPQVWAGAGPRFFMAGLAVMLASVQGADRRGLLALGEQLHPGVSEPAVFDQWLKRGPVRPSRFLPMLAVEARHAA